MDFEDYILYWSSFPFNNFDRLKDLSIKGVKNIFKSIFIHSFNYNNNVIDMNWEDYFYIVDLVEKNEKILIIEDVKQVFFSMIEQDNVDNRRFISKD